jgi:CheY-like chemotaxis protein
LTGANFAKVLGGLASLTWALLAAYVVWLLRASPKGALDRITGLEGWGVKFALSGGERALNAAFEIATKHPKWSAEATEEDRQRALEKAKGRREAFEGAEILWVDDRPSNNRNESRMLRSFGTLITFACTTDEALSAIKDATEQLRPFHLVLSDISRGPQPPEARAGLEMLGTFRTNDVKLPVIFYVGEPKPGAGIPPGAFGITHRPDILLTLVGDALERVRHR